MNMGNENIMISVNALCNMSGKTWPFKPFVSLNNFIDCLVMSASK